MKSEKKLNLSIKRMLGLPLFRSFDDMCKSHGGMVVAKNICVFPVDDEAHEVKIGEFSHSYNDDIMEVCKILSEEEFAGCKLVEKPDGIEVTVIAKYPGSREKYREFFEDAIDAKQSSDVEFEEFMEGYLEDYTTPKKAIRRVIKDFEKGWYD